MTKANAILPVYRRTMQTALVRGVDPYNSHPSMAQAYERYARACGAVPVSETVPPILQRQAD